MPQASRAGGPAQGPTTRRRFLRTAGIALGGGTAALGVPSATAGAETSASSALMSAARVRTYSALTEAVAGLRTVGDAAEAAGRLARWYAEAAPADRMEIDAALDAIDDLPAAFAELAARGRLMLLAEHMAGPQGARLTTAIGLAVNGLRESSTGPGNAAAAGQLYARTIRALPAQRTRTPPKQTAKAVTFGACSSTQD